MAEAKCSLVRSVSTQSGAAGMSVEMRAFGGRRTIRNNS